MFVHCTEENIGLCPVSKMITATLGLSVPGPSTSVEDVPRNKVALPLEILWDISRKFIVS